jgi:hypothetical protein
LEEIPSDEDFDVVLGHLARSKFLDPQRFGLRQTAPTLRRILTLPEFRARLGLDYIDKEAKPACRHCRGSHRLIEPCPPLPPCGQYHDPQYPYCQRCKEIEWAAQRDAEATA